MKFKVGDRIKLNENYYLEDFRNATGTVLEIRVYDIIVKLDSKYKAWDIDNYKNILYVLENELQKIDKPKKRKLPTLNEAFKDAEREKLENETLNNFINAMWKGMDLVLKSKPTKREKQFLEEMITISSNYGDI